MNKHNYMYSIYTGVHYMALLSVAQLLQLQTLTRVSSPATGKTSWKKSHRVTVYSYNSRDANPPSTTNSTEYRQASSLS